MKRREEWQPVLDAEIKKWIAKCCAELVAELPDEQVYEIEFAAKTYQLEVQLLENTDEYVHVGVFVDEGSIPASFRPLSSSFILEK